MFLIEIQSLSYVLDLEVLFQSSSILFVADSFFLLVEVISHFLDLEFGFSFKSFDFEFVLFSVILGLLLVSFQSLVVSCDYLFGLI